MRQSCQAHWLTRLGRPTRAILEILTSRSFGEMPLPRPWVMSKPRGGRLSRPVGRSNHDLTPRADDFNFVFYRESLGNCEYPSVGFVGFQIRQSLAEAGWTTELRFAWHVCNKRAFLC
jgi:hypothetical protein